MKAMKYLSRLSLVLWVLLAALPPLTARQLSLVSFNQKPTCSRTQIFNSFIISNNQGLTASKLIVTPLNATIATKGLSKGSKNRLALELGYASYVKATVAALFQPKKHRRMMKGEMKPMERKPISKKQITKKPNARKPIAKKPSTKPINKQPTTFVKVVKNSPVIYKIMDTPCSSSVGSCQVVYGAFTICYKIKKSRNNTRQLTTSRNITASIVRATQDGFGVDRTGITTYIIAFFKRAALTGISGTKPFQPLSAQTRSAIAVIDNAYLLGNTVGLSAVDLGFPTNYSSATRFSSNSKSAISYGNSAAVANAFNKIKNKYKRHARRILDGHQYPLQLGLVIFDMILLDYTISTFLVIDVPCPTDKNLSKNALCQSLYFDWQYVLISNNADQNFANSLAIQTQKDMQALLTSPNDGVEVFINETDPSVVLIVLDTPVNITGISRETVTGIQENIQTFPPIAAQSITPTTLLTSAPTTRVPTTAPTNPPTAKTTVTQAPSFLPTYVPSTSHEPTTLPTYAPSFAPTHDMSISPTHAPTTLPTHAPSPVPTKHPAGKPTRAPTISPTAKPTRAPTRHPTAKPSFKPT
jgi:hypothetical protein